MNNLNEFITKLNENLQNMVGTSTKSILETCKHVREYIKQSDFYDELKEKGLSELLVFQDDITKIKYIYLRVSEDESNLKEIIEINTKIDYYDESNMNIGGVISIIECKFTGLGEKMKQMPLREIVVSIQIADIMIKQEKTNISIKETEEKLKNLKDINENFEIQLKELNEDLRKIKEES